jgi:disulfide bond formation protein DsbB
VRVATSVCIGVVSLVGALLAQTSPGPATSRSTSQPSGSTSTGRAFLPLGDVLPRFFLASGACDKARWKIVGIAASEWAFAAFLLFIVAGFIAARRG